MDESNVSCSSETYEKKKQEEKLIRQDVNNITLIIQYVESIKKMAVSDELKEFLSKVLEESENMKWEIVTQNINIPPQPSLSPVCEDEKKILEIIKPMDGMESKERITMLYMAIDYIYMHDGKLSKDKSDWVITKH